MSNRRPHIIRPNDGCELYNRVVFMDSESIVDNIDTPDAGPMVHHPYLVVSRFVVWSDGGRHHHDRIDWDTFGGFWDALDAFTPAKKRTVVYAHNMGYDFAVLGGAVEMARRGYTAAPPFDSGPVFSMTFRNAATKKTVVFLSSTNYYAASLAQLGRIFGIEKLDVDYATMTRADAEPYAIRDLDILDRAVSWFRDFVRDADMGTMSPTLASQAMAAFRHRFMRHDIACHCDETALQLERDAYYGGRVECFRVGLHARWGRVHSSRYGHGKTGTPRYRYHKLDVNSMYPAVMRGNRYPTKLRWTRRNVTHKQIRSWIDAGYLLCAMCEIETDTPCYPVVMDGVLLYPTGRFVTALCTPEIVQTMERGHLRHVQLVSVYEGAPIFDQYVDWFYPRKCDEHDPILRYMYKIFLNALYGKFGQRAHDYEIVGTTDDKTLFATDSAYNTVTRRWETVKLCAGNIYREHTGATAVERESYNSFSAIAAHVTSYARVRLWGLIEKAGREHVYYCDTDSLFVDDAGLSALADEIDPRVLGAMKNEGSSSVIELRNPKDYTFDGAVKRKGIPKASAVMPDGSYRTVQWPSFSGMMRRGGEYRNVVVYKHLDTVYKKAWVYPGGVTRPFVIGADGIIPDNRAENRLHVAERYRILGV